MLWMNPTPRFTLEFSCWLFQGSSDPLLCVDALWLLFVDDEMLDRGVVVGRTTLGMASLVQGKGIIVGRRISPWITSNGCTLVLGCDLLSTGFSDLKLRSFSSSYFVFDSGETQYSMPSLSSRLPREAHEN